MRANRLRELHFIVRAWNAGWSTTVIAEKLTYKYNYHISSHAVKRMARKLRKEGWDVVQRKSGWNMKPEYITKTNWAGTRNKKEKFNVD